MKKLSLILIFSLLAISSSFAQIGINTLSPDVKAVLDIRYDPLAQGGLLIPRMPQTFRINISSVGGVGVPIPNSLMIFDTDLNKFTYYDSLTTRWLYLNPFHAISNDPSNGVSGGRIGIGTKLPISDLHIKGSTYFEGNTTTTGNVNSNSISTNTVVVPGFPNNALVPEGVIVMWSGSAASKPAGWAVCDGTLGTPNLSDKFIIAAGTTNQPGSFGGNKTIILSTPQLPSHNHGAGSLEMKNHTHSPISIGDGGQSGGSGRGADYDDDNSGLLNFRGYTGGVDNYGSVKGINGSTGSTGSGAAIDITPPYYTLVYIMKLP